MPQSIMLDDKRYVVIPHDEYERLLQAARLPKLPAPDADGTYPAVEYARVSLARKIILHRESLGWTQAELARRSGVPAETLCRLETGKVTPALGTVAKLERALKAAGTKRGKSRK
jgi:DNA-binding XRE family transcriptional regulator